MAQLNVDPMKRSSIYAIFGKYYGEKLYKLLFDCCDGFCKSVAVCLGISSQGDSNLVLNQQGNWVQNSSGGGLLVQKVQLSSAQILALDTTPVTAIPAPGIGYAIAPISVAYQYNYGTVAYTGSSNILAYLNTKTLYDSLFNIYFAIILYTSNKSGTNFASSPTPADGIVENQPLLLGALSPFADGDGDLVLWISYVLIEI